jgi:hypothetical protein
VYYHDAAARAMVRLGSLVVLLLILECIHKENDTENEEAELRVDAAKALCAIYTAQLFCQNISEFL